MCTKLYTDSNTTYAVNAVEGSTNTYLDAREVVTLKQINKSNEHTGKISDEKVVIVCSCLCYVLNLE